MKQMKIKYVQYLGVILSIWLSLTTIITLYISIRAMFIAGTKIFSFSIMVFILLIIFLIPAILSILISFLLYEKIKAEGYKEIKKFSILLALYLTTWSVYFLIFTIISEGITFDLIMILLTFIIPTILSWLMYTLIFLLDGDYYD